MCRKRDCSKKDRIFSCRKRGTMTKAEALTGSNPFPYNVSYWETLMNEVIFTEFAGTRVYSLIPANMSHCFDSCD